MSLINQTIIYFSLILVGLLLEALIFQFSLLTTGKHFKEYHFSLGRYITYLIPPVSALIFIASQTGLFFVNVFIIFSAVGAILEWIVGFTYHMVMGTRLWTYHKYGVSGYTSLLAIPLWGIAGVFFWLLAQIFA